MLIQSISNLHGQHKKLKYNLLNKSRKLFRSTLGIKNSDKRNFFNSGIKIGNTLFPPAIVKHILLNSHFLQIQ